MAKRRTKQKSGGKTEKAYKTIGALWEHPEYGESITVDDYHGELVFTPIDKDGNEGEPKLVKRIYLSDPYNEAKNKVYDLTIDLNNDKCCEALD